MSATNPLGPTEAEVRDFARLLHNFLRGHVTSDGKRPLGVRLDFLCDSARKRLLDKLLATNEGGSLIVLMDRAFRMDAATLEFLALSDADFEDWGGGRFVGEAANVRIMEKLLRLEPWTKSGGPSSYAVDMGGAL